MRLKAVYLRNFRSYNREISIDIGDLTTFIGSNDIGKSTVLEAMEIFFNNDTVKIDLADLCTEATVKEIEIGCTFEGFSQEIVLDASANTTLASEYLLNDERLLEIRKVFNCNVKIKSEVFVLAKHPTVKGADDLLSLKIGELKKRAESFGVDKTMADFSVKSSLRKAIWRKIGSLELELTKISVDSEDAAQIWEKIEQSMPTFALFKSDRASRDDDSEVQDPMKIAVKEALKSLEPDLKKIKEAVHNQVKQVATRTLEKLREMSPELAGQLTPNFKAEPKWDGIFNLSLTGDNQIPINKRGSGVRRLILLNFFRAEAERKQLENDSSNIIYAIEEPETSQHPNNQKMLANALIELSQRENCQVIVTTHVPAFAGLLPTDTIRHVRGMGEQPRVVVPNESELEILASELGVFPDNKVKLLFFVEGIHDVTFLKNISRKFNEHDNQYIDLHSDNRVAFVPVGGSSLKEWVEKEFLKEFKRPEFHIYDTDDFINPKYRIQCESINARNDKSFATLTNRRELENYLPKSAIERVLGITLPNYDVQRDDVPQIVAKTIHEASESPKSWAELDDKDIKRKVSHAKRRLNNDVSSQVSREELQAEGVEEELLGWFCRVSDYVEE